MKTKTNLLYARSCSTTGAGLKEFKDHVYDVGEDFGVH